MKDPNTDMSPFYRAMRSGHLNRKGHALNARIVPGSENDFGLAELIYDCCEEG